MGRNASRTHRRSKSPNQPPNTLLRRLPYDVLYTIARSDRVDETRRVHFEVHVDVKAYQTGRSRVGAKVNWSNASSKNNLLSSTRDPGVDDAKYLALSRDILSSIRRAAPSRLPLNGMIFHVESKPRRLSLKIPMQQLKSHQIMGAPSPWVKDMAKDMIDIVDSVMMLDGYKNGSDGALRLMEMFNPSMGDHHYIYSFPRTYRRTRFPVASGLRAVNTTSKQLMNAEFRPRANRSQKK